MIANVVLENGPQYLVDNCDLVTLCSSDPGSYAAASTEDGSGGVRLGSKVPSISIAGGTPDGRCARLAAFTDGAVEDDGGSGSGMRLAFLDTGSSTLLATTDVTGDQAVVDGNVWRLAQMDVYTARAPS